MRGLRKPPRPHRVFTQHPRYETPCYNRGSNQVLPSQLSVNWDTLPIKLGMRVMKANGRKVGAVIEMFVHDSVPYATVRWEHPISEIPSGTTSIVPLSGLVEVIEVAGGSDHIIRNEAGNPIGLDDRYSISVRNPDGSTSRIHGSKMRESSAINRPRVRYNRRKP